VVVSGVHPGIVSMSWIRFLDCGGKGEKGTKEQINCEKNLILNLDPKIAMQS